MKNRDIATGFPNYVSQHLLLDVWNVLTWLGDIWQRSRTVLDA